MLINDIVDLLMGMPRMLAVGWGVWFVAGLVLSIWTRREKSRLVVHAHVPAPRPKSGPRPAARVAKPVPHTNGDPFGDLEALFNQAPEGSHRMPGEVPAPAPAPAINEPLRNAPVLAAPQSLP